MKKETAKDDDGEKMVMAGPIDELGCGKGELEQGGRGKAKGGERGGKEEHRHE